MKTILTYQILIIFGLNSLSAQQTDILKDAQWYITESTFRSEYDFEERQNESFTNFSIQAEPHPDLELGSVENPIPGKNNFLIIYEDGSYTNTYRDENFETGEKPLRGYNVEIQSGKPIKYLYFTNAYEDDDPESYIQVDPDESLQNLIFERTESDSIISVNHDIVKNKDVTIIANLPDSIQSVKEEGGKVLIESFKLCFNKVLDTLNVITEIDDLEFFESPVFEDNFILNGNGNLSNNCIQNLVALNYDSPVFINLRVPDTLGFHINKDLLFNLTVIGSDGNSVEIDTHAETIRDSHDPNFIRVKEIVCTKGEEAVLYRVQCKNIGPQSVPLKMFLTLPQACKNDVMIKSWGINDNDYLPNNEGYDSLVVSPLEDDEIQFDFRGQGIGYEEIAYVEFWVSIKTGDSPIWTEEFRINHLKYVKLQPLWPRTEFGNDRYAIENYYDPALINTGNSHPQISGHNPTNMGYSTHRHICGQY